jgi:hypothetical protein
VPDRVARPDDVAVVQRRSAGDPQAVDERAVERAGVRDGEAALMLEQLRVAAGDLGVRGDDLAVRPPDRVPGVQRDDAPPHRPLLHEDEPAHRPLREP